MTPPETWDHPRNGSTVLGYWCINFTGHLGTTESVQSTLISTNEPSTSSVREPFRTRYNTAVPCSSSEDPLSCCSTTSKVSFFTSDLTRGPYQQASAWYPTNNLIHYLFSTFCLDEPCRLHCTHF